VLSRSDIVALAERPDRVALRADLAAFFGPRADTYIRTAERALDAAKVGRRFVLFWSWPVFWSWFIWFAYRRRYGEAILAFVVFVVADEVDALWPETLGLVSTLAYLAICLFAKPAYLRAAFGAIARVDARGLTGDKRSDALAEMGGVSNTSAAAGLGALVATIAAWTAIRLPEIVAQADAWGLLPPQ